MSKVRSLRFARSDKAEDSSLISPLDLLEGMAAELRADGAPQPTSAVVVLLRPGYEVSFRPANLDTPELLALFEAAKSLVLGQMGYLSPPSDQ